MDLIEKRSRRVARWAFGLVSAALILLGAMTWLGVWVCR